MEKKKKKESHSMHMHTEPIDMVTTIEAVDGKTISHKSVGKQRVAVYKDGKLISDKIVERGRKLEKARQALNASLGRQV